MLVNYAESAPCISMRQNIRHSGDLTKTNILDIETELRKPVINILNVV